MTLRLIKNTFDTNPIAFDVTLRDGSYLNNFNFSPAFTNYYLKEINKLDIKYCEIGHGLGVGAYRNNFSKSKISDIKFLKVINSLNIKTKVGFFAQPRFLNDWDIAEIINSKIDFIRLGVLSQHFKDLYKPIELLLKNKKEVFVFFMQTPTDTPSLLKKKVKNICENFDIKNFYIVDSTGSMFFKDIYKYYKSIKSLGKSLRIGFHGHNNLGIANSNSFNCLENGFAFLDGTFMGVGRGAGNACLEHLLINYHKELNFKKNKIINLLKLSNIFKTRTRIESPNNSYNTLCGIMKIHEQNIKEFEKVKKIFK